MNSSGTVLPDFKSQHTVMLSQRNWDGVTKQKKGTCNLLFRKKCRTFHSFRSGSATRRIPHPQRRRIRLPLASYLLRTRRMHRRHTSPQSHVFPWFWGKITHQHTHAHTHAHALSGTVCTVIVIFTFCFTIKRSNCANFPTHIHQHADQEIIPHTHTHKTPYQTHTHTRFPLREESGEIEILVSTFVCRSYVYDTTVRYDTGFLHHDSDRWRVFYTHFC